MSVTHPHLNQADRDTIEDLGLIHLNGHIGIGEHAHHQEEATPA